MTNAEKRAKKRRTVVGRLDVIQREALRSVMAQHNQAAQQFQQARQVMAGIEEKRREIFEAIEDSLELEPDSLTDGTHAVDPEAGEVYLLPKQDQPEMPTPSGEGDGEPVQTPRVPHQEGRKRNRGRGGIHPIKPEELAAAGVGDENGTNS